MNNYPSVSVIVPVLNNQKGLDRCLSGLSLQSYPENLYEVVVVDNGSAVPVNIKETFPFKLQKLVCNKPGSYSARNAGVKISKGEIVVFIDSDCIAETGWIEAGVTALKAGDRQTIVGGSVDYISDSRPNTVELYQTLCGFGQKENIEKLGFSATANLFVLRESFFKIGFFDETLLSGGDREWCWRARDKGFKIIFEKSAIVKTPPRNTLKSAIKQARRVAGGRYCLLKERGVDSDIKVYAGKRRRTLEAIKWIFTQPGLTYIERIRILCVASVLKSAHIFETIKLRFGGFPERG